MARIAFLGLDFDPIDMAAMVATLQTRTAADGFAYVATPNVDHMVRIDRMASDDPARSAYAGARWCLCDSRVLAKIAAAKGVSLPVVPGSDLTDRIVRQIATPGDLIAIVGGDAATLPVLATLRPDLRFEQHIPPMGLRADATARAEAARFVAGNGARFTLIAVGSPQQELVAQEATRIDGARGTALCIGASIDFLTGRERRAPRWMQRASLEWLHRLAVNPAGMARRYLIEAPAIFRMAGRWRKP